MVYYDIYAKNKWTGKKYKIDRRYSLKDATELKHALVENNRKERKHDSTISPTTYTIIRRGK